MIDEATRISILTKVTSHESSGGYVLIAAGVTAVPPADLEGRGNQWTLIWL
jgi:hypothetical protein